MEILDTTSHTDQFKVRLSGGELKAGGYENKEIWLDKSKEQIQHFQDKSG
ncbi:MAG: hypothetical protein LBO09_02645 [Candidatus Peribacteria bacterium]|jgi:hypothetical protein|nr:hypothetical protein [Candidatus Peribacteria bacterium]